MKTKQEMFQKYSDAQTKANDCEALMKSILRNIDRKEEEIRFTIKSMKKSVDRLEEIALNKKVLTEDPYFDTLIAAQREKKEEGLQARIEQLKNMKEKNASLKNVIEDEEPEFFQKMQNEEIQKFKQ